MKPGGVAFSLYAIKGVKRGRLETHIGRVWQPQTGTENNEVSFIATYSTYKKRQNKPTAADAACHSLQGTQKPPVVITS